MNQNDIYNTLEKLAVLREEIWGEYKKLQNAGVLHPAKGDGILDHLSNAACGAGNAETGLRRLLDGLEGIEKCKKITRTSVTVSADAKARLMEEYGLTEEDFR